MRAVSSRFRYPQLLRYADFSAESPRLYVSVIHRFCEDRRDHEVSPATRLDLVGDFERLRWDRRKTDRAILPDLDVIHSPDRRNTGRYRRSYNLETTGQAIDNCHVR